MGISDSRSDFAWIYTDEPHATRRKEMLKKYPEIKRLMGHDTYMTKIVLAMLATQVIAAYLLREESWRTILIVGYCFGGVVNHSMTLAVHEIGHNLAFGHGKPLWNRWIGFVANCCIGIPISISFRRYHHDHHRYQGQDVLDPDVPSELEGYLFRNTFTKAIWMMLQPFFYAFRPFFKRPKVPCRLEYVNLAVQLVFNAVILYFCHLKGLLYLIIGTFASMGLHPLAGHFISEHYEFVQGHETYSYHGAYNYIAFNVGYHTEHHDFPNIPGHRLPLLRKIAPEYYEPLPTHTSFTKVVWNFIFNPMIGPYARIKRPATIDPASADAWKDR